MSNYFVRRMGQVSGPFTAADLKVRAHGGEVRSDDEVSRDRDQWVFASEVKGLEFGAAPPPVSEPNNHPRIPTARDLNLEARTDCAELVSMRAKSCIHCGAPLKSIAIPHGPKFSSLRALSSVYFAAGVLCIMASVAVIVLSSISAMKATGSRDLSGAVMAFVILIVTSGSCFVVSEGIDLFLKIEENTRGRG